jgi:hypothetical protein
MSEPRRWTLTGLRIVGKGMDYAGVLPSIKPSLEQDEVVSVREDCITDADVEAVAAYLADIAFVEVRSGTFHEQARAILSTILKDRRTA